ncbi:hypothetical protein [Piscirickettsia litoralis]|uniref:Uncharacterized protein n=1 Tax=Piscirickettsia litoralis TaxID=1891921 RepID=A0ABX2ZZH1_9GAMM|nr:hypothetical protein [Piscirickettsia litoralis]ODN41628.1 hypothetical protein BGC07_16170 [Piscirickettsia litoralis]
MGLTFDNNVNLASSRKNHVNFYYGTAILNSISDPKSWAGEFRYDYDLAKYIKLSANILTENLSPERRTGKGAQVFAYTHLTDNLTAALGVGPEYISNAKRRLNALITMNIDYVIPNTSFSIQALWNRVSTFGNRDTDDFMAGIGYTF